MMITNKNIMELGIVGGPHIPKIVENINEKHSPIQFLSMDCESQLEFINAVFKDILPNPKLPLKTVDDVSLTSYLSEIDDEFVVENNKASLETMGEALRTPFTHFGALMPDACPAGSMGTIPVGGVIVSDHIHPGMHSADVCCSVMSTNFGDVDPKELLDKVHSMSHFGPGGRKNGNRFTVSLKLLDEMRQNRFTKSNKFIQTAMEHMGTCGDGNHFVFVGKSDKTGDTHLVTHFGSRGVGAMLYKEGMNVAEKYRKKLSPETLKQNAWIPSDSDDGKEYWEALQLVRKWTKANHYALHGNTGFKVKDTFWNEHNFVFKYGDKFAHAKGATPIDPLICGDDHVGKSIIPLNMGSPILIVEPSGKNVDQNLGFCPHGAGRNLSRTKHRNKVVAELISEMNDIGVLVISPENIDKTIFDRETKGLDIRFHSGEIDVTELPSAYKSPDMIIDEIVNNDLATIVDKIVPYGCIMAGDWEKDKPWRKNK